jgi:hypothetical protein
MNASETPSNGQAQPRSKRIGDFAVPLLLFVVAIAAGAAGLLLLPDRGGFESPNGITIALTTSTSEIKNITLSITAPGVPTLPGTPTADYWVLQVRETAYAPVPPPNWKSTVVLTFAQPLGPVAGCHPPQCDHSQGGGFLFNFRFPKQAIGQGPTVTSSDVSNYIHIDTQNLLFSSDGVNVSGTLPYYTDQSGIPVSINNPPQSNAGLTINCEYPHASSYQWSGTIAPAVMDDNLSWQASPYPEHETPQVTAVNPSAQSSEDHSTFLAGALVGVSGAALIGALTELLHVHPQTVTVGRLRRRRRRGSRQDSGPPQPPSLA